VKGSTPIRDLNRKLGWTLPDEEASTIAGFVIHESEIVPEIGDKFHFHGKSFEVLGKVDNQITKLRIRR
jgi:Mg2+/Co2+ transporter CorB